MVLRRSVSAQRPPSALPQVIAMKVARCERGVEAQCLCQRPHSTCSDVIHLEIQFNQGCTREASYGIRPPQAAVVEAQHCHLAPHAQAVQLFHKPLAVGEPIFAPHLYNRICLSTAVRIVFLSPLSCSRAASCGGSLAAAVEVHLGARGNAFPRASRAVARRAPRKQRWAQPLRIPPRPALAQRRRRGAQRSVAAAASSWAQSRAAASAALVYSTGLTI